MIYILTFNLIESMFIVNVIAIFVKLLTETVWYLQNYLSAIFIIVFLKNCIIQR